MIYNVCELYFALLYYFTDLICYSISITFIKEILVISFMSIMINIHHDVHLQISKCINLNKIVIIV